MPTTELTERQWREVLAARQAMQRHLEAAYPGDAPQLLAVAIAGAFCDLCIGSSPPGQRALIAVLNERLGAAGLKLVPLLRH